MVRPKYPSDHRRYVRSFEDKLEKLSALSDAEWVAYDRLLLMLNRVKSKDGSIDLDRHGIGFVTRRAQVRHSVSILRALEEHGLCTLRALGEHWECRVPNWPEKQGFSPLPVPVPIPVPIPVPSSLQHPTEEPLRAGVKPPTAAPEEPEIKGFVSMLKGKIPAGLGQVWESPQEWLEFHGPLLIAEAQVTSEEDTGPKFRRAFKALMLRYWNNKAPKGGAELRVVPGSNVPTADEIFKIMMED